MQDEESGVPASDELSLEQSGEHFEAQPVEAATETTTASSLPPTDNHDGHARADDVVDIHCSLNGKWEDSFNRLLLFKAVHGHVLVPNRYPEDTHLGSWVSTQRRQYKTMKSNPGHSTPMTPARARRLEEIGFEWTATDPRHVSWETRYAELVAFKERFGHAQVPIGWKENVQLSNWVSTQRQEYKLMLKGRNTRLTPDRILLLNKVQFVWEAQRGGPRRQERATVCVPEQATPAQHFKHDKGIPATGLTGSHPMMMPGYPMMPFPMPPGLMMPGMQANTDGTKRRKTNDAEEGGEEATDSDVKVEGGVNPVQNPFFNPQMMMNPQMMAAMGWPMLQPGAQSPNGQMAYGFFPMAAPYMMGSSPMGWPQMVPGAAPTETDQSATKVEMPKEHTEQTGSDENVASLEKDGDSGKDGFEDSKEAADDDATESD